MVLNIIDVRRGLYNKCLELFANKKIAEQIYRYLCDGVEDCVDAALNSCEYWDSESHYCALHRLQAKPIKHGMWIKNDNGTYSCSECHSWIPNEQHHYARYCLYCGAIMKRGEINE